MGQNAYLHFLFSFLNNKKNAFYSFLRKILSLQATKVYAKRTFIYWGEVSPKSIRLNHVCHLVFYIKNSVNFVK